MLNILDLFNNVEKITHTLSSGGLADTLTLCGAVRGSSWCLYTPR